MDTTTRSPVQEKARELVNVGVLLSENITSPGVSDPVMMKKAMQAAVTA